MLHKIKFYGSISAVYLLTLGVIGAIISAPHLSTPSAAIAEVPAIAETPKKQSSPKVITGKPTRLVIATAGIDLPVAKGVYDKQSKSWTLSPDHAHFAVMTQQPNDLAGTTFIYGHGTDKVFGKIGTNRPPIGTTAQIYTSNKHVFLYKLREVSDLKPHETGVLKSSDKGKPRLVIQTCTGMFSEWRTMFVFSLEGVL